MKNKATNIIQILLIPVFLISLFAELFSNDYWYSGTYCGTTTVSFYDKAIDDFADLGILWLGLIILSCALMLYMCIASSYVLNNKPVPKFYSFSQKLIIKGQYPITYFLPAVCCLSIGIYSAILYGGRVSISYSEYYYEFINAYIIIPSVIIIAMCVNCAIDSLKNKKAKNAASLTQNKVNPIVSQSSICDKEELIKLKELLDTNLITQEEFDAKKKQILGL